MNILTVFAHPNPKSFCHAILQQFTKGLEDAGHISEVVDLYAIRFDPVFRMQDFAGYVHESMPIDILEQMNLKQHVLDSAGGSYSEIHRLSLAPQQGHCRGDEIHPRT
jgi:NAD(P)H dehydrogenase (quinone)